MNTTTSSSEPANSYTTAAGVTIHMPATSPYDAVLAKIRLHPGYEQATMEVEPELRRITIVKNAEDAWGQAWGAARDANFRRVMRPYGADDTSMEETLGLSWGDVSTLTYLLIPMEELRYH